MYKFYQEDSSENEKNEDSEGVKKSKMLIMLLKLCCWDSLVNLKCFVYPQTRL